MLHGIYKEKECKSSLSSHSCETVRCINLYTYGSASGWKPAYAFVRDMSVLTTSP